MSPVRLRKPTVEMSAETAEFSSWILRAQARISFGRAACLSCGASLYTDELLHRQPILPAEITRWLNVPEHLRG